MSYGVQKNLDRKPQENERKPGEIGILPHQWHLPLPDRKKI